jgi:hypothetical protein
MFACLTRWFSFVKTKNSSNFFFLVYLESVDVNGDEYQNIEIAIDPVSNSEEISTDNVNTNETDSFNPTDEVSTSILITRSCSYWNNLFSEL